MAFSFDETFTVAIIGSPGHGKSTLLNALSKDKKAFEVASGPESCTQDISKKTFKIQVEGTGAEMTLALVDTPGFPDPKKENAIPYYDKVVKACNQPLNAIIWLVKQERAVHDVMRGYATLLREFNAAVPPIFLVVNGHENYEDEEERAENLEKDKLAAYQFAKQCAKAAAMSVTKIIVSTTKPDLKRIAAKEIGLALMGTTPKLSQINSYAKLEEEMKKCTSDAELARHEKDKLEQEINKMEQNAADEAASANNYRAKMNKIFWIPIVGQVGAALLEVKASACDRRRYEIQDEIREKKSEMRNLNDPSAMKRIADEVTDRVKKLRKTLNGQS